MEREDAAFDRRGLDLPVQQNRRGRGRYFARRADLRDAGHLFRGIQDWLLDFATAAADPSNSVPFQFTRLSTLGFVCAAGLAGIHWLAFSGDSIGGHRLFFDAAAD